MSIPPLNPSPFSHSLNFDSDLNREMAEATKAFTSAQAEWTAHAKNLTRPSQELFLGFLAGMYADKLTKLHKMILDGCTVKEFRAEVKQSLGHLNDTATSFLKNRAVYQEKKEKVISQLDRFDQNLQHRELSFASFEPSSEPPLNLTSKPHHSKNFQSIFKDWTNRKLAHHIHHLRGSFVANAYEIIANAILEPLPQDRASPYRDLIISSCAHAALSQVVETLLFRTNLVACSVLAASDIACYGAKHMQPVLDQLAQNRDVAELWDRSWLLSGQEGLTFTSAVSSASCLLDLAQVPSQLVEYIHHETTDLIASVGDSLGLTDENVNEVVQNSLEHMSKQSPALFDPEFWEGHDY